jgi:hypothetical protein
VPALCALLAGGALAIFTAGPASAAAIHVHCPTDNLQTAINAAPSGAMLIVDGTCVGAFNVAGKTITLDGPAALDGNHFFPALTVGLGGNVKLISITLQNGHSSSAGGDAFNQGVLSLQDSTVTGGSSDVRGGGIANQGGTVNVVNSQIVGNGARNGGGGVANFNVGATPGIMTISGSTIDHNGGGLAGGGIWNHQSTLTLLSSFVTNNTSADGGGIYNDASSTLTVKGAHVNNNDVNGGAHGGGVFNGGTATVTSTEIFGNAVALGAGIWNSASGDLKLKSSAVTGNTALGGPGSGGGVNNNGSFSFPGSTIANNTPNDCTGC